MMGAREGGREGQVGRKEMKGERGREGEGGGEETEGVDRK